MMRDRVSVFGGLVPRCMSYISYPKGLSPLRAIRLLIRHPGQKNRMPLQGAS